MASFRRRSHTILSLYLPLSYLSLHPFFSHPPPCYHLSYRPLTRSLSSMPWLSSLSLSLSSPLLSSLSSPSFYTSSVLSTVFLPLSLLFSPFSHWYTLALPIHTVYLTLALP